jgi:hypothetical protein
MLTYIQINAAKPGAKARSPQGKKGWSGFLDGDDRWQDGYVARRKGAVMRYFANG